MSSDGGGELRVEVGGEELGDGELGSPEGRRKSTRASAMRATERLRGVEPSPTEAAALNGTEEAMQGEGAAAQTKEEEEEEEGAEKKKPRLAKDYPALDPSDPHFAIQMNEEGDVVVLSDDSEVSSLHEDEIRLLRKNYQVAPGLCLAVIHPFVSDLSVLVVGPILRSGPKLKAD